MRRALAALVVALWCGGAALAADTISPDPKLQFFDSKGLPLTGGKLFTYGAGTTTKANTYTDSVGLTPNTNPVILNTRGETPQGVFLPPGLCFKYVLSPSTDTDPPTNAFWTVDGICADAGGTVISVGMTVPTAELAVSPGVITSSGTFVITKQAQTAHTVWAGPQSGSAAPTFRVLTYADLPAGTRLVFTADMIFCVASTGNDSNSGVSPNCWATLQHAWNYLVSSVDMAGHVATINIADGNYSNFYGYGAVLGASSAQSIIFAGNVTTPTNVQISAVNASTVMALDGAHFFITGVTLTASGSASGQGNCLFGLPGGTILFDNVDFGTCAQNQIAAGGGATVSTLQSVGSNYKILSASSGNHVRASGNGLIQLNNALVTLTGTPNFTQAFASATTSGVVEAASVTWSGTASGVNCTANLNGVINGGTGSPQTYFPGSSGTCPVSSGGQVN